mmetsp:Transcript_27108/g.80730  ORF Transcript_27108/g.80730 Transcript_27108/m.80730 type:complete len:253 (+) Transcript_27108:88-846(+)
MPWMWMGGPKGWGKGGGGGYGKGWGKGGGKGWSGGKGGGGGGGGKPQALPEGFSANTEKTYTGTVSGYYKFNGYGFITPNEKDDLPSEKVFAHWKNIKTSDRYPSLTKDMVVTFKVQVVEKQGVNTLQAIEIGGEGGEAIMVQDEADDKKTFVGGKNLRYTGTLKFFVPKRGYGYIKIDPGFQYDKEGVPEEIRVETAEMNCGGGSPKYMTDVMVEFGIWVSKKGAFKGYNVTLPGGAPLEAEDDQPKEEAA